MNFLAQSWLWFHPAITRVLGGQSNWHVEHTDALVALRALPDNSVDACVTDPPSGIAFMGKDWDHDKGGRDAWIAWLASIMTEVARVLKPGAHAFVWSLPRTSHWTGMALEQAGLEIRDSFNHIFSTGFPKSKRLGDGIGSALKPATERWFLVRKPVPEEVITRCLYALHVNIAALFSMLSQAPRKDAVSAQPSADPKRSMANPRLDRTDTSNSEANWCTVSSWLSILADVYQVMSTCTIAMDDALITDLETLNSCVSKIMHDDMRKDETRQSGLMRNAASVDALFRAVYLSCGVIQTRTAAERVSSADPSLLSSDATVPPKENANMAGSHDCWWLVRKPFDGTLEKNYTEHGTGGLNIDACRVAHASPEDLQAHQEQVEALKAKGGSLGNSWKNSSDLSGANDVSDAGRWPPNLAFSHHPDCERVGITRVTANPTWDTPNRATEPSKFTGSEVSKVRHATRAGEPSADRRYTDQGVTGFAALPGARRDDTEAVEQWNCVDGCPVRTLALQSGELSSGMLDRSTIRAENRTYGKAPAERSGVYAADKGSAARFFPQFQQSALDDLTPFLYQAKPSTGERDQGLEAFRVLSGGDATGRKDGSAGVNNPRAGAGRTGGRRNHHATVKSVELIRYLTRLITPPAGIVIDPFAGSGTGGVAALQEGARWLGFELNDSDEEPSVSVARARISGQEGRPYTPRPSLQNKEAPARRSLFSLFDKP